MAAGPSLSRGLAVRLPLAWGSTRRLAAGLLVLGAMIRALRFADRFDEWMPTDGSRLAIPAIEILRGTLPVDHLGVEYMGASPSYPLAAWFALAGISTLAFDLFAYGVGLAILWTSYLVARRLLDRSAALLTLAVLAVPPPLLAQFSMHVQLNYPFMLLIGNLFLLGTHTLFFRRPGCSATLLVLGLLAGLGWWTNPLFVVYLAPFGLLLLRTGLIWRARAWLFPVGVLFGGLPAWVYEFWNFPSARFAVTRAGAAETGTVLDWGRAALVSREFLPSLLGADLTGIGGSISTLFALTLLLLGVGAVARAAVRDRDEMRWVVGLGGRPGRGDVLLWGLFTTNLALVFFTPRGAGGVRYLVPLFSVLPCWLGELLCWLWGNRRAAGAVAVVGVLGFQLWANWTDTLGGTPSGQQRWQPRETAVEPMVSWLEARGFSRVYWAVADMPSFLFTYLAQTRVVAADLWRDEAPPHADLVDAAVKPPIVVTGEAPELRESLQGLGMVVRETRVGQVRVVEADPGFRTGFVPVRPDGWRVTASVHGELARNLVDRDVSTGWGTGGPQAPGQWVVVDMGQETEITRVDFLAVDWQEVPAGFRVEVSRDGVEWQVVQSVPDYWGPLFFSEHHAFLRVRRGRVQAIFPPVGARYVRIVQTGKTRYEAWSARELFIFRPGPPGPPPARPGELTAALRQEGVSFVYANAWLSARVRVESRGTIGVLESNLNLNSYGRTDPAPEVLERLRPEVGRAILVGSDGDEEEIRRMLAGEGVAVREAAAGPYRLLVFLPGRRAWHRLDRDGWTATASENAGAARLAIDGDRRTRWKTAGPAGSGVSFTLDLGRTHEVSGVRLTPGTRGGGPTDFEVEGSTDRIGWVRLEPLEWAGPLYWSGSELLRYGTREWAVEFPATSVRYLRLRPLGGPDGRPWGIEEIECFD